MRITDIAWNNLRRRKAQMLFLLLGMVIGVTTIVALFAVTRAMEEEVGNKFDQIGSNIVIVPKSDELTLSYGGVTVGAKDASAIELSEGAMDKIYDIHNAESIAAVAPKLLGAVNTDAGKALAVGVDFNAEIRVKKWWKIDGNLPHDQQVVLGHAAAAQLNKTVGSTLTINQQEFVVAGVLQEIGTQEDHAVYLHLNQLQNMLGKEGRISFIEVSALCYTCPIEEIVHQISHELPEAKVTAILEAVEARKAIVDKFSLLARAVSAIVLLIGALVVANTVMSSVNLRTREIGIFRAIGFRKTHIVAIVLLETTLVSVVGGVIGYLAGMVLAKWLAPVVARMEVPVLWDWQMGAAALGLAILTGIVASIIPAWKAGNKNPADALRYI